MLKVFTHLRSLMLFKNFGRKFLSSILGGLIVSCLIYLVIRPNVIGYDSASAFLPVVQLIGKISPSINQNLFFNLSQSKSVLHDQTWFPIGYAWFPAQFEKLAKESLDPLEKLSIGITASYVLFFVLGSFAWIRLIKKLSGKKNHLYYLTAIYIFIDWNHFSESIGFVYEWAVIPITFLIFFFCIENKRSINFLFLGIYLAALVLLKLSLLIFSIAILFGAVVYLTLAKRISLVNCLISILGFVIFTLLLKSYLDGGRKPDHELIKNIFNLHVPVTDSGMLWLHQIQSAALGSYWTNRNDFGGKSLFYYYYLPVTYSSFAILIALIVVTFGKTSFFSDRKLGASYYSKIDPKVICILLSTIIWAIGISISIIFAYYVGLTSRYYVLPIKLFIISSIFIVDLKPIPAKFRIFTKLLFFSSIALYSYLHLNNIQVYLKNALNETSPDLFPPNIGLAHGAAPFIESRKNSESILVSGQPEILLLLYNYKIVRLMNFETFAKNKSFHDKSNKLPISKFRFFGMGNPLKLVKKLENLLPFTTGFWKIEKTEKSPYFIVYLNSEIGPTS